MKIWIILVLILLIILGIVIYFITRSIKSKFAKIVRDVPMSLTFVPSMKLPKEKIQAGKSPYDYSMIEIPKVYIHTFDVRWKWPGCIPPAENQGNCGSCWAFAVVQCLAARFLTCKDSKKCIRQGDLEKALNSITTLYKIQKLTLEHIFNLLDIDNNQHITKSEWLENFKKYKKLILNICKNNKCKIWDMPASHLKTLGSTIEILMFMLNPPNYHIWDPSMIIHGVVTHNKFLDKNANIMFHAWTLAGNDYISIKEWIKYFHFNPLNLSVEQVLLCCADRGAGSCIDHPSIKDSKIAPNLRVNNAACKGNTLDDAWFQLYTAGTVSSYCMKYNLQSYKHQRIPSCLELQGPGFSYCSGALPLSHWNRKELNKLLLNSAKSNTLPFTPQLAQNKIDPKKTIHLPQWVDPILFIFKSMKPYKVAFPGLSNEKVIKRELYAHGPVTTAMTIYEDFEIDFANPAQNAGGRNWKKGDKIKNLIYAPKPKQAVVGGHAIMITGWGVYQGKYPYWIILNSWGVNWGHGGMPPKNNHQAPPIRLFLKNKKAMGEGYFWIKRGNNTCGIESNAVVANANIDNIVYNPESNTRIPEVKYNKYGQFMYEPEPLKAGGQWNYPFGIRSQYDPPSPFTLKWPENIKRPIYTLGTLSKDLNIKDTNLEIDSPHALHKLLHSKPDYKVLKYVPYGGTGPLANKLEKNPPKTAPIVLIDEEFVQVYEYEGGKFKILRGIWGSTPKKHAKGEQVKIFPYQNLDSKQLKTKE